MPDAAGTPLAVRRSWPAWAVYLGVSWTWCIGMFLPALLWRDFGVWSFVVFAVPNVVGAALLGVVMRSPEASRLYLQRHRLATWAFSAVTVTFQTFFAAWVARVMGGGVWYLAPVLCVVGSLGIGKRAWAFAVAAAFWAVSIAAIVVTVVREGEAGLLPELTSWPGALPAQHLAPLAMVCVLGFMLCPYLDRTFHRARIETGALSGRAFSAGFGFFFALMIVGTLLTTPVLLWLVSPSGSAGGEAAGRVLIALFAAHTLPQLVFTCWVHGLEGESRAEKAGMGLLSLLVGLVVVFSGDALLRAYGWTSETRAWANPLFGGEVAYRCFMAFYGLVAPAYVAIVSWPVKRGGAEVRAGRVVVFAVVVLAAVWFYWVGFVERKTWWVAVGVLLVVCGKLVGRFVESKNTKLRAES